MDKSLTVYPIPTGNELNVFSAEQISTIKIMDMQGGVVFEGNGDRSKQNVINITALSPATYIVEVVFPDRKTARSVFVKL
jgi:hypothetical protein